MAGKGSPKGVKQGGRKKGTPNKRTRELQIKAAQMGFDPVEFLLVEAANPKNQIALRIDAAKAAAPYVRPRLSSIEHKGSIGFNAGALSDEDLENLIRIVSKASGSSTT
jgi:hypothetical protein